MRNSGEPKDGCFGSSKKDYVGNGKEAALRGEFVWILVLVTFQPCGCTV
jgi:hypothetical protein